MRLRLIFTILDVTIYESFYFRIVLEIDVELIITS